jgi:hypothetical protein
MGKRVDYSNLGDLLKAVVRLLWRTIFFGLGKVVEHSLINCCLGEVINKLSIF